MALKIVQEGNGIWYVRGTVAGKRIRQSLGTRDRKRAEEARAQIEAREWAASVYGAEHVVMFEDAALSYLQDGGSPRYTAPLIRHFKGRALKSITPKDIRDAARKIYPTGKGATLNRQGIAPARAIINHAADQGWCASIRVKQFPIEKPERQAVSPEWIIAVRRECFQMGNPWLAAILRFCFETGCRISEATRLRPANMKMAECIADLGKTKNGKPYIAHFSEDMREELKTLRPRNGKVFGYQDRQGVYRPLKRACRLAGVEYVPPHQAGRHSFATRLHAEGWDAIAIAKAGRWESVRLVQETYVHTDSAKQAAETIGRMLTNSENKGALKASKKRLKVVN